MKNAVIIYTDTISREAVDRYVRQWSREEQRAYGWKRRRRHMTRQKVAGFVLLAITDLALRLLDGDVTMVAITVPAGIGLILSAKG